MLTVGDYIEKGIIHICTDNDEKCNLTIKFTVGDFIVIKQSIKQFITLKLDDF